MAAAVAEAVRAPHDERADANPPTVSQHYARVKNGLAGSRSLTDPERIAHRVERAGFTRCESLLVALAAHVTVASPVVDVDIDWIASAAARVGDADLLLETAGVVFAFNAINRVADARRVRLEYRFLRGLPAIRGWVERRFASLTGVAYDLSYKHQPRHSPAELLERLGAVFGHLGATTTPDLFRWLSQSPVVLEGVLELLEANITSAGIGFHLLKEAAAIAVASRAMPGSSLRSAVDEGLSRGSSPDSSTLHSLAALSGAGTDSDLVSACRRYSWRVANAAYTISDEQIGKMLAFGLSDAELLDLTLATGIFSALAIIEPISAALAPGRTDLAEPESQASKIADGRAQQCSSAPRIATTNASSSEAA